MTERITRAFVARQAERLAELLPGASFEVEGGPGWTLYRTDEGHRNLAYGRTKGELSYLIAAIEVGVRIGLEGRVRGAE